ncbi:CMRF35-like molecule 8 isoform X2 [Channa argus]|uniref:CMRF35-like molecule 8 isoform X2 n=1 Tax=Channa argus TaxID=215402 RepID=UPI0035201189
MAVHFSFLLIFTGLTGVHCITTVKKVSVAVGDSITIPCLYHSKYINHVKYLCKGYNWLSCTCVTTTNQPNYSEKFSISDDKANSIFTVTIKNITDEDTDYWCVVEINRAADDGQYFHLSVNTGKSSLYVDHQEITAFNGDNKTINFHSHNLGEMKWCRLGGSCGSPRSTVTIDVKANMVFTVTMSGLTTESSGWYLCVQGDLEMPVHLTVTEIARTAIFASLPPNPDNTSISGEVMSKRVGLLLLPLGLLIFIVIVTLFIWFRFKTPKQSRDESSVTMQAEGEVTYCDVKYKKENKEQDVIYSNAGNMRGTLGQMPYTESDVDVTYSSVAITKKTVKREHKTQHISNNIQHSDSALPPN